MTHNTIHSRFFIALMPSDEAHTYTTSLIKELGNRYHTRTAKAPPHITLQAPFHWSMDQQAVLVQSLLQFAHTHSPVSIQLSGFGSFPPSVLYINVVHTPELMALQSRLAQYLELELDIAAPNTQTRSFSPHLTVASRKVTPTIFRQIWTELKTRSVTFQYVSDCLTLLMHDGQQWQVQSHMPLLQF